MHSDFGYSEEKRLGKPYDLKMLGRLYPFARPYRRLFLYSIVLVVAITLLELALPYVTKIAIDRYIVPAQASRSDAAGNPDPVRRLTADLNDTEIAAIVDRYPRYFVLQGRRAFIALNDLPQLADSDIARLRRDDLSGVQRMALLFLGLIVLNFGLNFTQVQILERAGQQIMHDLRMRLFNHIQGLSVSFFARQPVGRLVTRMTNDIGNMQELFTAVISFVFKDLFLLVGIAGVLISIDWQLALLSFAILPVVVYASIRFAGQAREVFRTLRIKVAEINTCVSETISGMRVIQLFRQETRNYDRFEQLNHENYQAGMTQIHVFAVFMPIIELLASMALAIVIFYGGGKVVRQNISLGALVAFISYVRMFFRPIRDIAEKYNIMQNAMASAERIFQIFDSREHLPRSRVGIRQAAPAETIKTLAFERVEFAYVTGEPVLEDVSFRVQAGQTVAVVGPTGSGKTSLIHLIPRFYDPTGGRVRINGRDIRHMDPRYLRSKMALVLQEPFLFSGSVEDNITYGNRQLGGHSLDAVVAAANCRQLIDRLPQGLATRLSEGGASISSGERQLLSIARAFAHDPELIILDEATSYIDSETEQKIQTALANLTANRTAIIVAHRLSTARHADRIMVLHRGRIIESGSHDALMAQQGFYYRLNQLQG